MKQYNEKNIQSGVIKDWAFHGDVLLFKEKLPDDFYEMKKIEDGILALGEATGHNHALFGSFDLRECPKTKVRHLRIVEPTLLKHQEHNPIEIQPGTYRIGIVREFDHFNEEIRKVED